jgi:hypothetical protein
VSNEGFIFLLALGTALLIGIVATANISALRFTRRRLAREKAAAAAEPEFQFGDLAPGMDVVSGITGRNIHASVRHVDRARA